MNRVGEVEFRAFFADVYADALRFAVRRTSPERAEDAVAEAMLVAWRRFEEAPAAPGERRAWLFGIVRNTLLNAIRAEARQSALAVKLIDGGEVLDSSDHADDVGRRLDLLRAWERLDSAQQEVLALTAFEQLTAPQAARVLGISSVGYRARLSRARRSLRISLQHPGPPATRYTVQEAAS